MTAREASLLLGGAARLGFGVRCDRCGSDRGKHLSGRAAKLGVSRALCPRWGMDPDEPWDPALYFVPAPEKHKEET